MEYLIILSVFVLDQITKFYIQNQKLMYSGIEVIRNFFYITYVKNTGAAWSMFSGHQVVLALLASAAIIVMFIVLRKSKKAGQKWTVIGLSLMIGGAAGNLFDRITFMYVRDFLNFYIFGYDFPVFNVADISLCIGVGLLILAAIIEEDNG